MAKRRAKAEPPYKLFEYGHVVQWPRETLYEYAPDMKKVDRLIARGRKNGKPRETLKSLRELVVSATEDGSYVTVASASGEIGCMTAKYFSEALFQTRNAEIACIDSIDRLARKDIDLVKVIGRKSCDFCTAFVGVVFSISGQDRRFPPLATMLCGHTPFHVACTKSLVAFIPELADAEDIAAALLPPADAGILNLTIAENVRKQMAQSRAARIMAMAGST